MFFFVGLGGFCWFLRGHYINGIPFFWGGIKEATNVAGHFEGIFNGALLGLASYNDCSVLQDIYESSDTFWSIYMYLLSQDATWQRGNLPIPQNSKDSLPKG